MTGYRITGGPPELTDDDIPGSKIITADCGHQAKFSPSSIRELFDAKKDVKSECHDCGGGADEIMDEIMAGNASVSPTSDQELAEAIGPVLWDYMKKKYGISVLDLEEVEDAEADRDA